MVGRKRGRGSGRQERVKEGMEKREGTVHGITGRMDDGGRQGRTEWREMVGVKAGNGEGTVGGRTGGTDVGREGCTDGRNGGRWREGVMNVKSKKMLMKRLMARDSKIWNTRCGNDRFRGTGS